VPPDEAESLKRANMARVLGEKSQGGWGCPPACTRCDDSNAAQPSAKIAAHCNQ